VSGDPIIWELMVELERQRQRRRPWIGRRWLERVVPPGPEVRIAREALALLAAMAELEISPCTQRGSRIICRYIRGRLALWRASAADDFEEPHTVRRVLEGLGL
jgi:hypothetical protein